PKIYLFLVICAIILFGFIKFGTQIYFNYKLSTEEQTFANIYKTVYNYKELFYKNNNSKELDISLNVYRINKDLINIIGKNDIFEDSTLLFDKLSKEKSKDDIQRKGFLDKLIYINNKETNGYYYSSGSNILNTNNYSNFIECFNFSNTWSFNSNNCQNFNNNNDGIKKFYSINNIFLLRDYLLTIKNNSNTYISILNINGYLNFFVFNNNKQMFSTLEKGESIFSEIYIPYNYKEQSNECEEFSIIKHVFYSEEKCINYKKMNYNIEVKILFKDGKFSNEFFSTKYGDNKEFKIELYKYIIFNLKLDTKIDIIFPTKIHKNFSNIKEYLKVSVLNNYGTFIDNVSNSDIIIK
ncbi:MAG: hypothetical protein PHE25_05085, partial [Candidatus Gracilibacteria bacterium]|nr:hypothetical protein [Candidatus Gracilibacteria bacterium]